MLRYPMLEDVLGLEDEKSRLRAIFALLKSEEDTKVTIPKAILLSGPSGTGKTFLMRAISNEFDINFQEAGNRFTDDATEDDVDPLLILKKRLRSIDKKEPNIIFIDEIDLLLELDEYGSLRYDALDFFLKYFDGFNQNESKVIFVISTNKPELIPEALLRAGRIDKRIDFDLPSANTLKKALNLACIKAGLSEQISTEKIVSYFHGATIAEVNAIINNIALYNKTMNINEDLVIHEIENYFLGNNKDIGNNKKSDYRLAIHEAAHAFVDYKLNGIDNIMKVSLISRSNVKGYYMAVNKSHDDQNQDDLANHVKVALAGYASELLFLNSTGAGVYSDLEKAYDLVVKMVKHYGMTKHRLKPFSSTPKFNMPARESITKQKKSDKIIAKATNRYLKETMKILKKDQNRIQKLAETLIEKRTLSNSVFKDILEANS